MCFILLTLVASLVLQSANISSTFAGQAENELTVKVKIARAAAQIEGLEVEVVSERVLDYDKAEVEVEGEFKRRGQALVWDGQMLVAADSKIRTFKKKFILMAPKVRAPAAVETNGIADIATIDWKGDITRESIAFKPIFEDIVPKGLQDKWWHRTSFEFQGGVTLFTPSGSGGLSTLHGSGLTMMSSYRAQASSYLLSVSGLNKNSMLHHLKFSGSYLYTRTKYEAAGLTITPSWMNFKATQEFKKNFVLNFFYPTLSLGWEAFDRNSPDDTASLRSIGPHYSYRSFYVGAGALFGVIADVSADLKLSYYFLTSYKDVQQDPSGIVANKTSIYRAEIGLSAPIFRAKARGYGFYLTAQGEWSRLGVGYSSGDVVTDVNNLGVLGVSYRLK